MLDVQATTRRVVIIVEIRARGNFIGCMAPSCNFFLEGGMSEREGKGKEARQKNVLPRYNQYIILFIY